MATSLASLVSIRSLAELTPDSPQTGAVKGEISIDTRTANGIGMLLYQGARALELWSGLNPPIEVMREALTKNVYGR